MANLKTKAEKHANDNEKRRRSLKEREKTKLNETQIIKQALSSAALMNNSSRKITFSDEDDEDDESDRYNIKENLKGSKKLALFDNSVSSEGDDCEIRENVHFSGKKGFELLNLQSAYNNDKRFKFNERFLEDEFENLDETEGEVPDTEFHETREKTQQLKILEGILGTPLKPEKEKKLKQRVHEMVRYDASNKDHEIYEIVKQSNTLELSLKKKKVLKNAIKTDIEGLNKPKVSKEKFYKVSSEIKNQLKEKENGHFSVLKAYTSKGIPSGDTSDPNEIEENSEVSEAVLSDNFDHKIITDSKNLEKKDKQIRHQEAVDREFVAKGIWRESFFFEQSDVRFRDGLEFINQKNSVEAKIAAENYDKTRKKLKEILRLHLKKQLHKKDPFKNKIGGMNKKQLEKFKCKNSKMIFSKRNPLNKSHGEKI